MVTRTARCVVGASLLMVGCELTDITIPPNEAILVISSVLNTARTEQFVIVENSQSGGEPDVGAIYGGLLPDGPPRSPVSDAVVTLTHLTPGLECAAPTVRLDELPPFDDGFNQLGSGRYVTSDLCALRPNDVIALEVRAPDGRVVRGRTRIPGARGIGVGIDRDASGTPDTLTLHRLEDSLWVNVDPIAARAVQLEVLRADRRRLERPPVGTYYDFPHRTITDTMAMMFPGTALAVDGSDGQQIFRAGLFEAVTVSVTDTNYFDFTRSGSDDFTGRGFINHLEGGIGVFGSVSPVTPILRVISDFADSREGIYRMAGMVDGKPVDVTWQIYLDPNTAFLQSQPDVESFFALVEGVWGGEPIATNGDGTFGGNPFFPFGEFPLSGSFVVGVAPDTVRYFVGGTPRQGSETFAVSVFNRNAPLVTQLEAIKLEGRTR